MLEITHVRSAASPSPHLRLGMNISPGLSEQSGTTGQAGIASRGLTKQGVILLYITSPRLLEQSGTPGQAGIASRGQQNKFYRAGGDSLSGANKAGFDFT